MWYNKIKPSHEKPDVVDKIRLKTASSATEATLRMFVIATIGIILARQRTTKEQMHRLICSLVVVTCGIKRF